MKKKVTAPLSYDPGKGRPKEHLAYLNWQEMQQLQRLNGGNMERGPRGLPSFPPADARGSSSRSSSSPSRSSGGGGRDSGQAASRSSGSYGGGGRDTGGRGNVGMGKAPSSSRASSGSYGGGGRDTGGKGNVGMGRAPSAAKTPIYGGGGRDMGRGRSISTVPSTAGVRSIASAVKPSRTSVYSSMNLRGPLGPDGSPIPQVTTYATNFQTAQMMRSMYPDVAKKYTQGQIVGALEKISSALPGEADVAKYGPGPMTDLGRVSLNQIVGGFSPKEAVAALDTTGIRKKTKGLEVPGPNSLGMTENWKDKQSGLSYKNMAARSIQDALLQRNVSPEAMNASNFVAAGSKPVPGTKKIGDPVRGTQFLHDPNWGNRIASRNLSASGILGQTDQTIAQGATPSRRSVGSASAAEEVTRRDFAQRQLRGLESDPVIKRELKNALAQSMWDTRISDATRMAQKLSPKGAFGEVVPQGNLAGFRTLEQQAGIPKQFTRIKDPSSSYHTWGLAVDVVPERLPGETQRQYDLRVGEVNREIAGNITDPAVTWGGSWKNFVDPGHFQYGRGPVTASVEKYGANVADAGVRPSTMLAGLSPVAVPAGAPPPRPTTGYPGGRPASAEPSVASVSPSQIGSPEFQPYGMTVDQEKIVKQRLGPAKIAIRGGTGLAGVAVPFAGLAGGFLARGYEKNVERRVNEYVAASPSERAAMEAKDPAIIGWARAIGIQPQNDYSVYQAWAQERGLRSPEESRGNQQDVQYAGGIGALPSATTPVGTSEQTGSRPYEYYQWDVGVNIPSPGDPNYTSYQEYLRRRAQAQA